MVQAILLAFYVIIIGQVLGLLGVIPPVSSGVIPPVSSNGNRFNLNNFYTGINSQTMTFTIPSNVAVLPSPTRSTMQQRRNRNNPTGRGPFQEQDPRSRAGRR